MKPLELAVLTAQIAALRAAYPEIDEDESLLLGMLEGETPVFDILAAVAMEEREADELESAAKAREQTVRARRMRFARKKAALRALEQGIMEASGIRKAVLGEVTLSLRPGRASVVITDEDELPERFWKVTREARKDDIAQAIKAGEFVPGAQLSNGGDSLTVTVA